MLSESCHSESNTIFTALHFLMVWNILKTIAIHLLNMNDAEIPTVPIFLGSRSSVDMGFHCLNLESLRKTGTTGLPSVNLVVYIIQKKLKERLLL